MADTWTLFEVGTNLRLRGGIEESELQGLIDANAAEGYEIYFINEQTGERYPAEDPPA
jgi:hypothetical protein